MRRAAHVGGAVRLIRVIPAMEFVQWGAVQQAMEAEAIEAAEVLLKNAADEAEMMAGVRPETGWCRGESVAGEILKVLQDDRSIRALVLASAEKGAPGPLVSYFTGERVAALPCLVIIVPGALSETAVDTLA